MGSLVLIFYSKCPRPTGGWVSPSPAKKICGGKSITCKMDVCGSSYSSCSKCVFAIPFCKCGCSHYRWTGRKGHNKLLYRKWKYAYKGFGGLNAPFARPLI